MAVRDEDERQRVAVELIRDRVDVLWLPDAGVDQRRNAAGKRYVLVPVGPVQVEALSAGSRMYCMTEVQRFMRFIGFMGFRSQKYT